MDPALLISIATVAPGFILFLAGSGLRLWRQLLSRSDSLFGIRLSLIGLLLMFLVPGVAILVGVGLGTIKWPALVFSAVSAVFTVRFVRLAGRLWEQTVPAVGINPD